MVRTAVLVSGGGTNLQALIDARDHMPSCELALVVSTKPDAFALERAGKAGIPTEIFSRKQNETDLLNILRAHEIQFVIQAGFLRILDKTFTDAYKGRCINIHPALLPKFGGKG